MGRSVGAKRLIFFAALALGCTTLFWHFGRNAWTPENEAGRVTANPLRGDAVARVAGREILETDMAGIAANYPHADPIDLLAAEIRRRSVVAAARDAGYLDHPEVQRRIDEVLASLYLRDELQSRLADVSVAPAEVDERLARVTEPPEVPARRAAILRLQAATDAERSQARMKLEEALEQIPTVRSHLPHFGLLAERYSDHAGSKRRGGVIGRINPEPSAHDRIPREVHAALWQLDSPGDISPVIQAEEAMYLVRFVDEDAVNRPSAESRRAAARRELLNKKQADARQAFFDDLQRNAEVLVRSDWQSKPPVTESTLPSVPPMPGGLATESASSQ